jgi:hypothetical protein
MSANAPVPVSFDALAVGRSSTSPFVTEFQTRNPNSGDVNFPVQQRWFNTANSSEWILTGYSIIASAKTAIWQEISGTGVAVEKTMVDAFTPPGTNPVVPDGSSTITVTGGQVAAGTTANVIQTNSLAANTYTVQVQRSQAVASSTVGDNGVSHFNSADFTVDSNGFVSLTGAGATYYSLTPYIVGTDIHSQYSTISAAIAAAFLAGVSSTNPANIYIKPKNGGYTENPVLVDGINLIGFSQQTLINGKVSMTTNGTATISSLTLQDNGDYALQITGSVDANVYLTDCNFNIVANTVINIGSGSSSTITLQECTTTGGASTAALFVISSGTLRLHNCDMKASDTTASTVTGALGVDNSGIEGAITINSGGEGAFINSTMDGGLITINGTGGNNYILNSYVNNGTNIALTIGAGAECVVSHSVFNSSAMNVITGTGTMNYAFLSFVSSSGVSVSTATPLATLI